MRFIAVISALFAATLAAPSRDAIPGFARDIAQRHSVSTLNQPRALWPSRHRANPNAPATSPPGRVHITELEFVIWPGGSLRDSIKVHLEAASFSTWCAVESMNRRSSDGSMNIPCNNNSTRASFTVVFSDYNTGSRSYETMSITFEDLAGGKRYAGLTPAPKTKCVVPKNYNYPFRPPPSNFKFCRQKKPKSVDLEPVESGPPPPYQSPPPSQSPPPYQPRVARDYQGV